MNNGGGAIGPAASHAPMEPVSFETARAATVARRYLACRQRRTEMLAAGIFVDPAWNMLLDLFAARAEGTRVSVSSACIASGVPTSTALRWVAELEKHELVSRQPDPLDGRRTFLEMGADVAATIENWLNATFVR